MLLMHKCISSGFLLKKFKGGQKTIDHCFLKPQAIVPIVLSIVV